MKTAIVVFLIVVCLLSAECLATPVYGTITMTPSGFGAKDTMKIWGGGHTGLGVSAGVYMFNKTAGSGQGQLFDNGYVGGLCMDLSEYIGSGSRTYDIIMPQDGPRPTAFLGSAMGTEKAAYLSELWGRYYDPAWVVVGNHTSQQNSRAEAFAASVWEIIYEDLPTTPAGWNVTIDATGGNRGFKAENLDYLTANNWLRSLNGTGPMAQLRSLSYIGSQDMLVAVPPDAIPEPATIAFVAFGFLVIARRNLLLKIA